MRYLGIDLARSVAIFFVIIGHALTAANLRTEAGAVLGSLSLFLAASAPVFFCLFGTMLQLVYARKFAAGHSVVITQRLWSRGLQCWALYALSCAVMCVAWKLSFTYWVRCSIFFTDTYYTDILRFYAVMLALAPLMILVSVRIGLWPLVIVAGAIHMAFPIFSNLGPMGTFTGAENFSSFLYGGNMLNHSAPSVLHGFGFVVSGMVMGKVMAARPGRELLLSGPGWGVRGAFIALVLVCAAWMWAGQYNVALPDVRAYLRNANHPLYLLTGVAATVVFIDVFGLIRRMASIASDSVWMVFGRTSLFTFAFGNSLLYIVHIEDRSAPGNVALLISSVAAVMAMSLTYALFRDARMLKADHWAARLYRAIVDDGAMAVVRWVTAPVMPRSSGTVRGA